MQQKTKKILLWIMDLGLNIVIIIGLVIVIQTWIVAPFDVSGASMCDTLNKIDGECVQGYGEKLIINEAGYIFKDPERGDVVVFKAPSLNENDEDKYFIKRVIGLPGETVELKNGEVYLTLKGSTQSIKLQENYLNENNRGHTLAIIPEYSVFEVPEGHYLLLGDNRQNSTDSRSCFRGFISNTCSQNRELAFIPKEEIRGKAFVIWWPLKNMRLMPKTEYSELVDTF